MKRAIIMFLKKYVFQLAVTFCVGAIVTGSTIYFSTITKNGKGGFEMPVMPQYNEEISQSEKNENAALLAKAEAIESMDESEIKPLTYMTYRLKPGDMIGTLAERFNVTSDTLISVNNIRASRYIQAGQYIKIPSEEGILYTVKEDGETPATIAEKYEVDALKCAYMNNMSLEKTLNAGDSIFVPGAELDYITKAEINGDLFRKPIHSFYRLTSYYGWRPSPFTGRRSWHGGLDMACATGTRIYAGMDGRVVETGYNDTYGNYVIIRHYAGYKTLYGHMSKIIATQGQYVTTNTVIGLVGNTGNSTGPHVHFTVFKNGRMINPLSLLG